MTLKVDGTNGILQAYDYQVLTTGFSYTFAAGTQTLVINPAGTLATGTITMPASPVDGMVITFSTTQQITALTVSGNTGKTITSAPTFMAAGSSASYVYNLANTAWRPLTDVPQLLNVPLGANQTWTNVTASRAVGTTYTNSTGRTIALIASSSASALNGEYGVTINGSSVYGGNSAPNGGGVTASAIIPSGATYSVNVTGGSVAALGGWWELR